MIFVTTGTQAPFNRLVKAIDDIAPELNDRIIIQALGVDFKTSNVEILSFLAPEDFDKMFSESTIVISHAGMGSIISALTIAKPIVVVPRIASLGEHRNEHQLATAKKMEALGLVSVVYDLGKDLKSTVIKVRDSLNNANNQELGSFAPASLVDDIKNFINS